MNQTQQWLHIQTSRLESQVASATQQIARATTMEAVIRASHVSIPVELRGIRNSLPSVRRLNSDVTRRLQVLLDAQLKSLEACSTADECKNLRGRYMSQDWQSLRGLHGNLYNQADRQSHAILWAKQQRSAK